MFEYMKEKERRVCRNNYFWNQKALDSNSSNAPLERYSTKCKVEVDEQLLQKLCKVDCDYTEYQIIYTTSDCEESNSNLYIFTLKSFFTHINYLLMIKNTPIPFRI